MNFQYREKQSGGYLTLLNQAPVDHNDNTSIPGSALLTIAWNTGAPQTVWVDDIAHTLGANEVILLINSHHFSFSQPAQVRTWRFNREFYCIIDHDQEVGCVGLIFYGIPSPMILRLADDQVRKMDLLYQVFLDEFATHDNIQGEMLRMLLKRLIILLTRMAKEQHLKSQPVTNELDTIRRFNLLVEKNFHHLHQVQDYAELLHKSPKTLSNLFGKYSDKTPLQIIRERIAIAAKRQLRYTDKPVSEIGYELGFSESAHFSRFFKKLTGLSPNNFRTELSNQA